MKENALNIFVEDSLKELSEEVIQKMPQFDTFDEFAERCATMPPERAAEICQLKAEDIIGATRLYATSKPASITWGLAFDQNQNGSQAATCVLALMALSGNVYVPGGNIIGDMAPQGDK